MEDSEPVHDYTNGASQNDIEDALSESKAYGIFRSDSQVGSSYGVAAGPSSEGAVFDGPINATVPSSFSRMNHREMSRDRVRRMSSDRSSRSRLGRHLRRRSEDSIGDGHVPEGMGRRYSEADMDEERDDGDYFISDEEDAGPSTRISQRHPSISEEPIRTSVFGSIANIFGRTAAQEQAPNRRRPSLSAQSSVSSSRSHTSRRRSIASETGSAHASESEIDNPWGYSSGEEESENEEADLLARERDERELGYLSDFDYGSRPPSPTGSLPNMMPDPIFGDTRIDMELAEETSDPPPPGPPSRQHIYMQEEDITVRFVGYEILYWRMIAWRLGCFVTLGLLGLLGHWFPRLWLRWTTREKSFSNNKEGVIVVESPFKDITIIPLKSVPYPFTLSTAFPTKSKSDSTSSATEELIGTLDIIDYRYLRFALDPRTGLFSCISEWKDGSWTSVSSVQKGLTDPVIRQRCTLFGFNVIDIQGKSTTTLLVEEVIHPFYVFQIASIILWSLDDYYYYAFCIAVISLTSIISTLLETKKTMARMRDMSRFSCPVGVYRDGVWQERDSADLVPGDILSITQPALSVFPADMILLSGDAIVNESMLTGESVPVSKIPIKDGDLAKWRDTTLMSPEITKSFLYSGTRVVRVRGSMTADGSTGGPSLAIVARTGFYTTKGSLIRSMLFPKPLGFAFYRDSMRFIGVLAGIAGLGFLISAFRFVELGVKWHTILLRALDLITVVVPPALPATLSIGTTFALNRLRKHGIFCISPNRINVSGKIHVCCFDKTGTLTEDDLDILGVRSLERNVHRFGELLENIHDLQSDAGSGKALFLHALATCHMLQTVNGEVVGDPLDIKMFRFTQWTLEEGQVAGTGHIKDKQSGTRSAAALVQNIVRPPGTGSFKLEDALKGNTKRAHFLELGVIRTFEFVSALRRMSVIVKRLKSSSMEIYVKGAPEVMVEICERDSLPHDYDDLLSYYTKRGYRVIAMAGKSIEGLTWLRAQRLKREQVESNLRFLGLIIFENKLKPGTTPVIKSLRNAHMACRMITGDNPLTAVSVARECGLINPAAHVFSPFFLEGNALDPNSRLSWPCMDDPHWKLDEYSLKPLDPPPHHTVESANDLSFFDYTIVITGDVFRWMINYGPLETLQRMLVKSQVYARMSPDEKNEVVERLQALGYTVLMCGDGANDCAALKAADVGLSLSEAEASVAAPFTSRTPDITCVLEVIKEGRAALVTSFSCFKYMALYSLIQFTTITLLYSFASSLGDFQFLYIDLFIIIPIAVTMGRTLPYNRIHLKRPTASLVSKKVLASIIGQIVITGAVQLWVFLWVRNQPWYSPPGDTIPDPDSDKLQATNYENTTLFLVSCFQYILVAAVFSIGPPYRQPMWTNGLFMVSLILIGFINVWLMLKPAQFFIILLELMVIPTSARFTLLFVVIINVAASMAYETWGTSLAASVTGAVLDMMQSRKRIRDGKAYKAIENGMS